MSNVFDTNDRTPAELEHRRRELAFITSTLRRKNAGPPRRKSPSNGRTKFTVDDLEI
jgi:hypothetical protein